MWLGLPSTIVQYSAPSDGEVPTAMVRKTLAGANLDENHSRSRPISRLIFGLVIPMQGMLSVIDECWLAKTHSSEFGFAYLLHNPFIILKSVDQ